MECILIALWFLALVAAITVHQWRQYGQLDRRLRRFEEAYPDTCQLCGKPSDRGNHPSCEQYEQYLAAMDDASLDMMRRDDDEVDVHTAEMDSDPDIDVNDPRR